MPGCGASKFLSPERTIQPAQRNDQEPQKPVNITPPPPKNLPSKMESAANAPIVADQPKFRQGVSHDVLHANEHLEERRTKIVATLGPASIPKIRQLISTGVNVFRLNFSHVVDPESQRPVVDAIRRESADLGLPVAILGDLCGPKIRCNTFAPTPSIHLIPNATVRLLHTSDPGTDGVITTSISQIVNHIEIGHRVLLNDGSLKLVVTERVSLDEVLCRVVVGGELKAKKGINVPDMALALPALTEKDAIDARFMYKLRLDYVALSFVQRPQDVQDLLNLFDTLKREEEETKGGSLYDSGVPPEDLEEEWRPHIIAKIETPHALDVIDDIIYIADGIMVARGDLGVECSLEQVPLVQKTLIRKTNAADKPVITATQMLESMISAPVPTRAEVSDVANAVFDGTDAVMLSAECATGDYPIETVAMMSSICRNAEAGAKLLNTDGLSMSLYKRTKEDVFYGKKKHVSRFAHCIADAAVAAASEASAKAMLVFTTTSEMPIFCSKRRPTLPIIGITPTPSIYRRLALLYGIHPVLSNGLKISTLKGSISLLREEHVPLVPQHAHHTVLECTDSSSKRENKPTESTGTLGTMLPKLRTTEAILALTERDILESPSAKLTSLAVGDPVCWAAGYHGPFPGLSSTIKMSIFGDAVKSEKAQMNWAESLSKLNV